MGEITARLRTDVSSMLSLELLAPAKDLECGQAASIAAPMRCTWARRALAHGAAGNTSCDIEKLAAYAHRVWARVLRHGQYPVARRRAGRRRAPVLAASSGWVDGLIIQDVGLLECDLPPCLSLPAPRYTTTARNAWPFGRGRFLASHPGPRTGPRPNSRPFAPPPASSWRHSSRCLVCEHEWTVQLELCSRWPQRQPRPVRTALSSLVLPARCCARNLVRDKHLLSLREPEPDGRAAQLVEAGVTSFKIEGRLKKQGICDELYVVTTGASWMPCWLNGRPACVVGQTRSAVAPDPDKTFNTRLHDVFPAPAAALR